MRSRVRTWVQGLGGVGLVETREVGVVIIRRFGGMFGVLFDFWRDCGFVIWP